MDATEFKPGDLVRVKSGGPIMTVEQVGKTAMLEEDAAPAADVVLLDTSCPACTAMGGTLQAPGHESVSGMLRQPTLSWPPREGQPPPSRSSLPPPLSFHPNNPPCSQLLSPQGHLQPLWPG